MELEGERFEAQKRVSRSVGGGAFIAPQENLPIGMLETQTCPGQGSDMSGKPLWNLTEEPDKSSSRP
jgi:hypothetical protein